MATSISTGGNGADSDPAKHAFLKINPHLKFYNNQRGYVLTKIEKELMTADFRVVPQVQDAGVGGAHQGHLRRGGQGARRPADLSQAPRPVAQVPARHHRRGDPSAWRPSVRNAHPDSPQAAPSRMGAACRRVRQAPPSTLPGARGYGPPPSRKWLHKRFMLIKPSSR
ncbi:hypothetical protein [Nonomuraea dietziae]|uniref:hypothetical protein n=1 Tax=Nonomuraea dietziae TaxID=65515 RepID=UPI0031E32553